MANQEEQVLAAGSGMFLCSLAEAWYESGLSRLTLFVTDDDAPPANPKQLDRLKSRILRLHPATPMNILEPADSGKPDWSTLVKPFTSVLYVSQQGNVEELRELQQVCIEQQKSMLPALLLKGIGAAGPFLQPDGDGLWESAWRRLHCTAFPGGTRTDTAAALLANLIVHEWRQAAAGASEPDRSRQVFLLDPVTSCGGWHAYLPHPLVSGYRTGQSVPDALSLLEEEPQPVDPEEWFAYFGELTTPGHTGIFHEWEEKDLTQLPLSQCLVRVADPLSEGPAQLLPPLICQGLTHEEARREAGLAGLEAYAARMLPLLLKEHSSILPEEIGIGAGGFAEAMARGLRACLEKKRSSSSFSKLIVSPLQTERLEDVCCQFYTQALTVTEGPPLLAMGEPMLGLPTVWVYAGGLWYGSADLHPTLALRQSLQKALSGKQHTAVSSVSWKEQTASAAAIPSCASPRYAGWVKAALAILAQHGAGVKVFDLRCEAFLREGPLGVYGVILTEKGEWA